MAATIGASEVFKELLHINFQVSTGKTIRDLAFSLFDFGIGDEATAGEDVSSLELNNLAVAGAGAGGTAVLYTVAGFRDVTGEIDIVEPGHLKKSSLGRYLMTTHHQVHSSKHKIYSVEQFLDLHVPELEIHSQAKRWHEVDKNWRTVVATVDTAQARRDIQRSDPDTILEAGTVGGTLYTVLRVVPDGWCLSCKHPPDPDVTWKKRAARWGLSTEEVRRRYRNRTPVTRDDINRLAEVQNRPVEDFLTLEGMPFDEIPELTECGETPLFLEVPSQAPVLPLATTAAGIVLTAEIVKEAARVGTPLKNYFAHELRHRPRRDAVTFKPRRPDCPDCNS